MDQHEQIESVVRLARALHDVDWGDWTLSALRGLVDARPGWSLGEPGPFDVMIRPGTGERDVIVSTGKHGPEATRYGWASVPLPASLHEPEAFAALVQALQGVGAPVPHRGTAAAPGLRWRDDRRVMILQRNAKSVWLAVHPAPVSYVGEVAAALHDIEHGPWTLEDLRALADARPGWELDGDLLRVGGGEFPCGRGRVRLLEYAEGASLEQRRAAFGDLFDAVVGGIGDPTLYGGSADGPGVRWRNEHRLLMLRGDRRGVWLESHPTEEIENEEYRTFEWGGAWNASEPSDFGHLPYIWQLDREGPGDNPVFWPGGRLATSMKHLREALELLLTAFAEQLPAQIGNEWATFQIRSRAGAGRIVVTFDPGRLNVYAYDRAEDDPDDKAALMRDRGWQELERGCWRTSFPHPDDASAAEAARLMVDELEARGAVDPAEDLFSADVSCNDYGWFRLTGLGVG
ncbi:hypothetical protein [Thermomonospora amylolytica]|uniref:hypothetical protein n=1 Tax=Thermomonospora amylolytica TaxID=1411117 RepID=UPI0013009043|nr:hypothetical protein [Thermomonospora amylolytica]